MIISITMSTLILRRYPVRIQAHVIHATSNNENPLELQVLDSSDVLRAICPGRCVANGSSL